MLACYQSGRQADAMAVYRHTRNMLVDELGTEPGRHLQDLYQPILAADPALLPARPAPPGGRPSGACPAASVRLLFLAHWRPGAQR